MCGGRFSNAFVDDGAAVVEGAEVETAVEADVAAAVVHLFGVFYCPENFRGAPLLQISIHPVMRLLSLALRHPFAFRRIGGGLS